MESELKKTEKKALELIARAEQCSAGLARKLEMRGHDPEIISEVIKNLTNQNLIDDSRYARLWLQTRVRLTRTPRRLIISLCSKGIGREQAQNALSKVFSEENSGEDLELAMLKRYADKQIKKATRKSKEKQETALKTLKYLLKSEGFSSEVIEEYFSFSS